MAVTKLWSVTERLGQVIDYATNPEKTSAKIIREFSPEQYQALADVIAYAKDEEKTEREFYVEGINCNVAIARDVYKRQEQSFLEQSDCRIILSRVTQERKLFQIFLSCKSVTD